MRVRSFFDAAAATAKAAKEDVAAAAAKAAKVAEEELAKLYAVREYFKNPGAATEAAALAQLDVVAYLFEHHGVSSSSNNHLKQPEQEQPECSRRKEQDHNI